MNSYTILYLLLGVILTHLCLVSSLPWKSPAKWKLPPLPANKRTQEEDGQAALLSRVRHLESLVQKRLEEKERLNRYRELERIITKKLADKQAQEQETIIKDNQNTMDKLNFDTQKDSMTENSERGGDPELLTKKKLDELAAQLEDPKVSEPDPIAELKEITRDLELLVDKLDRQRREHGYLVV